jgi:undecaprenyl diphosphate synthase
LGVKTEATRRESAQVKRLKEEIQAAGNLPRHIAIIMDGNGRWARRRGLPRIQGHQAGRKSVRGVVEACVELGIEVLTLYTFSIENWNRPESEVNALMRFLKRTLKEERDELRQNNVRLRVIGRTADLPANVRDEIDRTIEYLADGTGLLLVLALSYGGRAEIVDAVRSLARKAAAGEVDPDEIDEAAVESQLYTSPLPSPDLLIRTSGEMRISNFLLWQLAYAEIYVTDVLWPDFDRARLFESIREYQKRERRFGRVD